ncbi:sister chromatid cohesion protein DCC1 [Strigomonas culicis]|uniref:Sister chromatid cohesion protein DCC1 n=1 Tax=Strigomonas culicis TaxID=28005 RepID=S9VSY9_9TRYP|nr:sister chromatid cohesion protein DCC1 [Strigomonas culicis]|eukprot:EPY26325.1 sister chromatid cohesion protein DCC1 [Strigomonas culicis]
MDDIYLSPEFENENDFRLLSIDKRIASAFTESLERRKGVVMVLKGEPSLTAHTDSNSMEVRRVEYSNTLLLAKYADGAAGPQSPTTATPSSQQPTRSVSRGQERLTNGVVLATLHRIFETQLVPPKLNVYRALRHSFIGEAELAGHETGSAAPRVAPQSLHTFKTLVRRTQSSPLELAGALKEMGALVVGGHLRLLEPPLQCRVLRAMVHAACRPAAAGAACDWDSLCASLAPATYPRLVVQAVGMVYRARGASTARADAPPPCGLSELFDLPKVAVALAGYVFDTSAETTTQALADGARYPSLCYDVFFERWRTAVPAEVWQLLQMEPGASPEASLELLNGNVIARRVRDSTLAGATLLWAPRDYLPSDLAARVRLLFEANPDKWSSAALKCYVDPLLSSEQVFANVILRYAREYRIPGQPTTYASL